jgi:hypothetical protein
LRESVAAKLRQGRHTGDTKLGQSIDHIARDVGIAIDRRRIDLAVYERRTLATA